MKDALSREEELLKKIEEWRRKASDEADPFNKYTSVCIAYNTFYNLYAKKKSGNLYADYTQGDSKRAIDTITLVEGEKLFKSLETDVEEYLSIIPFFREEYWPKHNSPNRIPISKTLKKNFKDRNELETIDFLIKWLYKVRCNLVHGEKSYSNPDQRKLLEMSTKLLDNILRHLVVRYKQTYRIRD